MADSGNLHQIPEELYERYKNDGFSDKEIEQIWEDRAVMLRLYFNKAEKEPREITSSTYKNAQMKMRKKVDNWFFGR